MKKATIISIVLVILIITGLIYFFVIRKSKPEDLTDAELREILLKGNKISGLDIEAMSRIQLLAAIKQGGYKIT